MEGEQVLSKPTKVDGPKPAVIDGVNPLLLASYSRLSDIEFEDLSKLAAASECQLVPSNNVIYQQSEPPEGVYIVLDGAIRLEHRGPDETVWDHELIGLYMTFGDRALLGETIRHYTATAESYSVLLKVPFPSLQECCGAIRISPETGRTT